MDKAELRRRIAAITYRTLYWGRNHVPVGLRAVIGVLLMACGVFGFLPVLGFWMFPLGVAFVALELPSTRTRIDRWMMKLARDAGLQYFDPARAPTASRPGPNGPDQPTSSQ